MFLLELKGNDIRKIARLNFLIGRFLFSYTFEYVINYIVYYLNVDKLYNVVELNKRVLLLLQLNK